ncbi:cytochrome b [Pragia fontium]|uniref:Cytochrome b561 n=1 Tax=Pragia fontium DSM 5563 = ATCC 49100 TaxID=1122977 RepID=A0AAJ5BH80_9GAMM|nr:cytochrome b [Pragia fontium]SFC81924.1 Cytochrome b561 [Pragia fontium DSM 5563 = ATCC 49100]VEJ55521.1 Cytochrome b561 homolog 1 [Pragia fontium]
MKRFSRLQIFLHWLTLILLVLTYVAMEFRGIFPKNSAGYLFMRESHYNFGILVWIVMVIRIVLRRCYHDPVIIPAPPVWQIVLAKLMHVALYVTFLALPVLGILLMAYGGKEWTFLGMNIPGFVTPDNVTKSTIKEIHETWANIGYFLIGLHACASLFHHYIQKDNTLLRMMPVRDK